MTYTFKQWLVSVKQYVLMCLLLSGPDRLVVNLHNIMLSLFCYCLIGFALVDEQRSYLTIIMQIALELMLLTLVSYTGLRSKNLLSRLPQTFSALLGVNIIISVISIPVYMLLVQDFNAQGEPSSTALNFTWLIIFWNLAVMSQIFKQAFNINTLLAALISFSYFLVYQFMLFWLF
jgi:hypothetical protein